MVRVAVLVSGGGTNLQAIIDAKAAGKIPSAELALVLASNDKAYALERAAKAGIPSEVLRKAKGEEPSLYGERLLEVLRKHSIDLVVLHCTELPDLDTARDYGERIQYPQSGTGNSGHFYIDRDGTIHQYLA